MPQSACLLEAAQEGVVLQDLADELDVGVAQHHHVAAAQRSQSLNSLA
jgi:hypothetical protein